MRSTKSPVREQILEAATRLMHAQGYHRTAVDDVLRESGTGKGNFYHYFPSKEELGYAIVERLVQGFTETTLDPIFGDRTRAPLDQVEAFLQAVLALQRRRNCAGGCPMGNLATELADLHEGFRQRLGQAFEAWRARLAEALGRARGAGALVPEVDADAVARFLVAGLEGGILLARVQRDVRILETCVAELRRHLALYRMPEPQARERAAGAP